MWPHLVCMQWLFPAQKLTDLYREPSMSTQELHLEGNERDLANGVLRHAHKNRRFGFFVLMCAIDKACDNSNPLQIDFLVQISSNLKTQEADEYCRICATLKEVREIWRIALCATPKKSAALISVYLDLTNFVTTFGPAKTLRRGSFPPQS